MSVNKKINNQDHLKFRNSRTCNELEEKQAITNVEQNKMSILQNSRLYYALIIKKLLVEPKNKAIAQNSAKFRLKRRVFYFIYRRCVLWFPRVRFFGASFIIDFKREKIRLLPYNFAKRNHKK